MPWQRAPSDSRWCACVPSCMTAPTTPWTRMSFPSAPPPTWRTRSAWSWALSVLLEPVGGAVRHRAGGAGRRYHGRPEQAPRLGAGYAPPREQDRLHDCRGHRAPKSELADYPIALRAMTQGRGGFDYTVTGYDTVPANVAAKVIAALQTK